MTRKRIAELHAKLEGRMQNGRAKKGHAENVRAINAELGRLTARRTAPAPATTPPDSPKPA